MGLGLTFKYKYQGGPSQNYCLEFVLSIFATLYFNLYRKWKGWKSLQHSHSRIDIMCPGWLTQLVFKVVYLGQQHCALIY